MYPKWKLIILLLQSATIFGMVLMKRLDVDAIVKVSIDWKKTVMTHKSETCEQICMCAIDPDHKYTLLIHFPVCFIF